MFVQDFAAVRATMCGKFPYRAGKLAVRDSRDERALAGGFHRCGGDHRRWTVRFFHNSRRAKLIGICTPTEKISYFIETRHSPPGLQFVASS